MKRLMAVLLCGFALAVPSAAQAVFAAGVSYAPGATSPVAGTILTAYPAVSDSTQTFIVLDAVPTTVKPLQVQTQLGGGVAQRIPIGKLPLYVPTSAGVSWKGDNVGWAWSTGILASIAIKGPWRIMPAVRLLKSSVSDGTGYQVIVSVLVGYKQEK